MWGLSQIIKISIFAEKVKVKALFDIRYLHNCLKRQPLGGKTIPLFLVLGPLLAEISLLLGQFCIFFSLQGRASTAHVGEPGSTVVTAVIVIFVVIVIIIIIL